MRKDWSSWVPSVAVVSLFVAVGCDSGSQEDPPPSAASSTGEATTDTEAPDADPASEPPSESTGESMQPDVEPVAVRREIWDATSAKLVIATDSEFQTFCFYPYDPFDELGDALIAEVRAKRGLMSTFEPPTLGVEAILSPNAGCPASLGNRDSLYVSHGGFLYDFRGEFDVARAANTEWDDPLDIPYGAVVNLTGRPVTLCGPGLGPSVIHGSNGTHLPMEAWQYAHIGNFRAADDADGEPVWLSPDDHPCADVSMHEDELTPWFSEFDAGNFTLITIASE